MFCANCGSHLEPGAHFCGVCGHAIPGTDAPAAPAAVAPVPPPVTSTARPEPMPPAVAPYAGPSVVESNRTAPYVLILGAIASLALVAAVVALIFAVRRDDGGGPESFVVVTTAPASPASTAAPSTTASTTSTTVATTTTTAAVTTTAPPPITTAVPPPPPDSFVWPDMTGDAIGAVQGSIAACGQGGWVGDYSATAVADGRYRVGANVMFEGDTQSFPVAWEVDFTTNRTEVRPLDDGARALICRG